MAFNHLKFEDLTLISEFERQKLNVAENKQSSFEGLKNSLIKIGIKDPFTVKLENGQYLLCDGYIRYNIIKEILKSGEKTAVDPDNIPCVVIERNDIKPGQLRIEADKRSALSVVQTAGYMKDCIDKHNISIQEIADAYGITPQSVKNYLEIMRCIPRVQEAIDRGVMPMSAGKQFCVLTKHGQGVLFDKLVDRYDTNDRIFRKLIVAAKKGMSEDSFLNTAIKRMKLSEGLRKYKKGSTLKKEPFRRILDSTISKNEIEIRTLERRLDRVRDHVITLLKRWEIVFRRTEQRTYVAENYSDDFSSIAKMIRDELGIRVA